MATYLYEYHLLKSSTQKGNWALRPSPRAFRPSRKSLSRTNPLFCAMAISLGLLGRFLEKVTGPKSDPLCLLSHDPSLHHRKIPDVRLMRYTTPPNKHQQTAGNETKHIALRALNRSMPWPFEAWITLYTQGYWLCAIVLLRN